VISGQGEEKGEATLECASLGDPVPKVAFRRANHSEDYQPGVNDRVTLSSPGPGRARITIKDLRPSDAGNYTCVSRNKLATVQRDARLIVEFSPRFADNQIKELFTWAGQTRNMTCDWSAEPDGTVQWLKGGLVITENSTYSIFSAPRTSVLQITVRVVDQARIYDTYVCRVTNKLDSAETGIRLRRATAPAVPRSLEVMKIMPTEIHLNAVPPGENGGMDVVGYKVEYNGQVQEFPLGSEMVIKELQPSTTYILLVSAKNDVGTGEPKLQTVTTKDIQKPYPVIITSSYLGMYGYEYTLTWSRPNDGGKPITHYEIRYRQVEADVDVESFNLTQPLGPWISFNEHSEYPLEEFTLLDLEPLTSYQAEVLAYNSVGWSRSDRVFVFKTADGAVHGSSQRHSASVSSGVIVVIVLLVLFLFVVIVDVSCYFLNSCGVTACLCNRLRHGSVKRDKMKHVEEGENEKRPLSEFSNGTDSEPKTYKSEGMSTQGWHERPAGSTEC